MLSTAEIGHCPVRIGSDLPQRRPNIVDMRPVGLKVGGSKHLGLRGREEACSYLYEVGGAVYSPDIMSGDEDDGEDDGEDCGGGVNENRGRWGRRRRRRGQRG